MVRGMEEGNIWEQAGIRLTQLPFKTFGQPEWPPSLHQPWRAICTAGSKTLVVNNCLMEHDQPGALSCQSRPHLGCFQVPLYDPLPYVWWLKSRSVTRMDPWNSLKLSPQKKTKKKQRGSLTCSFEMPRPWHHFGISTHFQVGFARRLPLGEGGQRHGLHAWRGSKAYIQVIYENAEGGTLGKSTDPGSSTTSGWSHL